MTTVGQRIQWEDGRHARVAYVGPLPGLPAQRIFVGIEYDHAHQGKHDGCYQGVRIFGPTRLPNAASFVALDSIDWLPSAMLSTGPPVSSSSPASLPAAPTAAPSRRVRVYTGILLGDAIEHKYSPLADTAEVTVGGRTVEMILSHKDKHGPKTILSLPSYHIVECDCVRPLPIALESVQELDVSDNMIAEWTTAATQLFRLFSQLYVLNLSGNPIVSLERSPLIHASHSLRTLVLNRCPALLWRTVAAVGRTLPHLVELHLSENRLGKPLPEEASFLCSSMPQLKHLSLDGNYFPHWDHVEWIHGFVQLERLVLNQCGLTEVRVQQHFPQLVHLSLCDNPISTWLSIRQLSGILSLRDLRLQRCPIVASESDASSRLLIAGLLPCLTTLNGSTISLKEKEDSERLLLLRASELQLAQLLTSEALELLRAKHADLSSDTAKSTLDLPETVMVQLSSPFAECVVRSIPVRLTIAKLVALFRRCFPDLEMYPFELYVSSLGTPPERIPLELHSSMLNQVVPELNTLHPTDLKIEARI